jgi:hypothetical protein
MDPTIVTLISVITTGLVSILSVFVPIILESRKAAQAKISAERDRLETTTLDLLREISNFRRPIEFDIEMSSTRPVQQVLSDMQVRHYAWECAIWYKIDEKYQEQVRALRQKFELMSSQNLGELARQLSDVTDEILTLTRIASARF